MPCPTPSAHGFPRRPWRLGGCLLAALLILEHLGAHLAYAGQFAVQPIRLELSATQPSGALVIRNDESSALSFQVKGVRWNQDEDGQERYAEAPDLVYFPRLLTLAPGQSAVIRVGLRSPPGELEKTYRVFIEELAPAAPSTAPGARIRVLMRFGAPVFVRATHARHQLAVTAFSLQEGKARWTVHNAGSEHQIFQGITLRGFDTAGAELFRQEITERYLLAGARRQFQVPVPSGTCGPLARLSVAIKTDQSEISRDLDVGATPCD